MSEGRTLDVSQLAPGAFGSRSLLWWGTMGLVVIEGTMFALSIGAYFYLRTRSETWPPNLPQGLWRVHRNPGGRCPSDSGL